MLCQRTTQSLPSFAAWKTSGTPGPVRGCAVPSRAGRFPAPPGVLSAPRRGLRAQDSVRVRFRFVGAVPVRVMGRVIAKGRIRKGPPAGAGHADPQAGLLQQRVYVEVDLEIAFRPSLRGVDTLLCALPESRALCVCFFPNHNFLHSRHLVRLNIF